VVVVTDHPKPEWPIQEAKQRFSHVLREVERSGPQTITRHGEEVAVIIDIAEYRRLTGPRKDFVKQLMAFPKLNVAAGEVDVFDEIEAERGADFPREIDL
jgi:prevent-host-death family protein